MSRILHSGIIILNCHLTLSDVMFITTANNLETVPRPLLDRMEVIRISSYTEEEKVNIAIKYLIPKQIQAHGLQNSNLKIDEQAVRDIINFYTREAGVRNLEREIATVCRKSCKNTGFYRQKNHKGYFQDT